jgi:hypothetical protein
VRVLFLVNGSVVGDVSVTPVSAGTVRAVVTVPGLAHGVHKVTVAADLAASNYQGSTASLSQPVN